MLLSIHRHLLAALLLALSFPTLAAAQLVAEDSKEAPAPAADLFERETPRSTVTQLIAALAAQDYARAANYFDLPARKGQAAGTGASDLARKLQALLDQGGTLKPFGFLSNDAAGRVDDGLAADREDVGGVPIGGTTVPVLLARGTDGEQQVWRIAPETIQQIRTAKLDAGVANDAGTATGLIVAGAPLEDWGLLLAIAAFSFVLLRLAGAACLGIARRVTSDYETNGVYRFLHAAIPPLSLFLAVSAFFIWAEQVPVAIVARQTLLRYAGTVSLVALVWFALRLVDAIADVTTARMHRHERRQAVSVITLLRRAAKILLLFFTVVGVLDTFGIDVTTGIAALGIGGIALALGAQKTVENLVGSVTVIADRPVQVGDFCRVGDVVGTVEDVGIRSTRIRTNERTLVTIPNGDFASRQIENFSKRDRFLFNPTIGIEYGAPAAKVRKAVEIVEQVLFDHELVDSNGARARFTNFGESSLDIEVFSYITVGDFAESLGVRQELMLAIYDRFAAADIGIAFPTRTVFLEAASPLRVVNERVERNDGDDAPAGGEERKNGD